MKATELWGPIGINWKYKILEDELRDTAPLFHTNKTTGERTMVCFARTHTMRVRLSVLIGGSWAEVEHYGHTPVIYENRYGIQVENEPQKKSLTDALKKCLSLFGFSADVYSGQYDNSEYVEYQRFLEAERQQDQAYQKQLEERKEYADWKGKMLTDIKTIGHVNDVLAMAATGFRRANRINDQEFIRELMHARDERIAQIKANPQEVPRPDPDPEEAPPAAEEPAKPVKTRRKRAARKATPKPTED